MAEVKELKHPWLVAVWPGMGQVAITAGYYLIAQLGMHVLAEFSPRELFDVEHVDVKGGLIHTGRLPRNRFLVWQDPAEERDLVVLLGEAQPPIGKYIFCQKLIEYAQQIGAERIFTFAAMATQMHPEQRSRVFGAATNQAALDELQQLDIEILEDGQIGGLNGILLGAAAERGLTGTCLLGEMPHIFAQLPFPKASLSVLEVFSSMANLQLDLSELAQQARAVEQQLGEMLAKVESAFGQQAEAEEEEFGSEPPEQPRLSPHDERRIETLFEQAQQDRSKAYELKRELDRLEVFREYEDRFLDLFKQPE